MPRYEGVWRKRQLLPCWILQIICALIFAVVASLLLAAAAYVQRQYHRKNSSGSFHYNYYGYGADELVEYARITGGVVLVLSLGTVVFDIIEIVLYARRHLSPVLLLSFGCIKTLVWVAYFVLSIVAAATGSISILDLLLSLVLAITSLVQVIFGAVYTHRKRKGLLFSRVNHETVGVEGGYNMKYDGPVR